MELLSKVPPAEALSRSSSCCQASVQDFDECRCKQSVATVLTVHAFREMRHALVSLQTYRSLLLIRR
jgi:hypothetical protein